MMVVMDIDVLKEVFSHLIFECSKEYKREDCMKGDIEKKYRVFLINHHSRFALLSLLQEFHIAEVGHNNNEDLVENVASLVNYDVFLWKLDRNGHLDFCFGIDTRIFLYLVKNEMTKLDTMYLDFSYRMAPLRMDVLMFGYLGVKLDKDIFRVYEELAKSRRNSLGKIMRVLKNIRGLKKLHFMGSILNFLTEIRKILSNNALTLREVHRLPLELFKDPLDGLCFYPREISVLAAKSMCFWTPDSNIQKMMKERSELIVSLASTTSTYATASLNTISTMFSDTNSSTSLTTNQENITINKNFSVSPTMASTSSLHYNASPVMRQAKTKPLQDSQIPNQQDSTSPSQLNPEETSYYKKLVPFTSTKALEFHIKAFTSSSSKKDLRCKWEGCGKRMVFGGDFMLSTHMKRRHVVGEEHFYEMLKVVE